jgi:hypothetical protein
VILHAAIDRINERCEGHEEYEKSTKQWMENADRDLARIKFLGILLLATMGTIIGAGKWVIRSAVTDALLEHGVLAMTQTTGNHK